MRRARPAVVAMLMSIALSTSLVTVKPYAAHAADMDAARIAVRAALDVVPPAGLIPAHRDALRVYYEARGWQPVWVDQRGATRAGESILEELRRAPSYGLDAADFKMPANAVAMQNGAWTPEQMAAAEIELSAALLEYAREARGGRITDPQAALSTYLDRRPQLPDPVQVLITAAVADDPAELLRDYHPNHDQFWKLQAVYAAQLSEAAKAAETAIPLNGPLLVPGMRHDDVRVLRARLKVPASTDSATDVYDDPLVAAVKAFQDSADLTSDGYIGKSTRKALAAQPTEHLARLRANLEQWRWMPENLGDTHLFVNIPKFSITFNQHGKTVLEERIIVGKSTTQTPIFSKAMRTIVLRPEWQLPDSIKIEKLLAARRAGTTLEDQGYVIKKGKKTVESTEVDWSKADLSAYQFFQPSGDGNALGNVKFLFPNKHSVYLHDTPMKSLFDEKVRLFSHGCVRLRNPLALAQRLLDFDKGQGQIDVKKLVARGPGANAIQLDEPVPIHVAYFTAWVGDDGVLQTFADVYGHEERITLALDQRWKDIDKGDDHLAAVDTLQLKDVRIVQRPAAPPQPRAAPPQRRFAQPMGVTKVVAKPSFTFKPAKYRPDGGVGDIMRNSLMNN